jgi:hypothetical protein
MQIVLESIYFSQRGKIKKATFSSGLFVRGIKLS